MSLKEARKQLLYAFDDGLISDEECLLLYDLNRSTNLDFPYEQYPLFDLDDMQNDECLAEFRFHKNDLPILAEVLRIPDQFILEQRSALHAAEEADIPMSIQRHDAQVQTTTFICAVPSYKPCCGLCLRRPSSKNY